MGNRPERHALDAQVAFVVRLPMKPAQKALGHAMLMAVVTEMAREPDFISTWVHETLDDPNVLVLYERWACTRDEFIANHLSKPYRAAYEASLATLLAGDRHIDFLTPLASFPERQRTPHTPVTPTHPPKETP